LPEKSTMTLDMWLQAILEETRVEYNLHSLLLADRTGLAISHAGKIAHAGISAIAPELIRVGEHAARLGEYDSITCVTLILENSHLMIIKDIEVGNNTFVLVMDTSFVPKGILKLIRNLQSRLERAMSMEHESSEQL